MSYLVAIGAFMSGIMFTPVSDDFLVVSFLFYFFSHDVSFFFTWSILWFLCSLSFTWFYGIGYLASCLMVKSTRLAKYMSRVRPLLDKHGARLIAAAYFLPGLRHPIHYVAGFTRIPLKTYAIYNVSAAAVFTLLWAIIVRYFEHSFILQSLLERFS